MSLSQRAPTGWVALTVALLFVSLPAIGCGGAESAESGDVGATPVDLDDGEMEAFQEDTEAFVSTHTHAVDIAFIDEINAPFTGGFDAMVERRVIRALVVYSGTFYFLDGGTQRGIAYEALQMFEKQINEKLGTGTLKLQVALMPVRRDQLIPFLVEGKGDLAIGNLTITPERQEFIDFSNPAYSGVDEVVVTGPGGPDITSIDDLAGLEINVRQSSSYWSSLQRLNERFRAAAKPEMTLTPVAEYMEDEDLLQMVNASLLPLAIVDSHKAKFWEEIFTFMTVHYDVAVNTGGQIGWAFRKNSPLLAAEVNDFICEHKQGTLMGNILLKRYLQNTKYVEHVFANQGQDRFEETVDFFMHYADKYDFPYLIVAAQAYQESRLDQSMRSSAGCRGRDAVAAVDGRRP